MASSRTTVAAVILAAGAGRRFGGPKALVEIGGERLVERAVRLARGGGCEPVIVVLGAAADEVVAAADLDEAQVVIAIEWETGMGASLRTGLAAAEGSGAAGAVVLLVDQPLVAASTLARLRDAWQGGATAAVAAFAGEPRTPVLFDRSVWAEVGAASHGDIGARPWLRAHPDLVTLVECGDIASAADIDTPADLKALGGLDR